MRKQGMMKLSDPILLQGVSAASDPREAVSFSGTHTRVGREGQDHLKHGRS